MALEPRDQPRPGGGGRGSAPLQWPSASTLFWYVGRLPSPRLVRVHRPDKRKQSRVQCESVASLSRRAEKVQPRWL